MAPAPIFSPTAPRLPTAPRVPLPSELWLAAPTPESAGRRAPGAAHRPRAGPLPKPRCLTAGAAPSRPQRLNFGAESRRPLEGGACSRLPPRCLPQAAELFSSWREKGGTRSLLIPFQRRSEHVHNAGSRPEGTAGTLRSGERGGRAGADEKGPLQPDRRTGTLAAAGTGGKWRLLVL